MRKEAATRLREHAGGGVDRRVLDPDIGQRADGFGQSVQRGDELHTQSRDRKHLVAGGDHHRAPDPVAQPNVQRTRRPSQTFEIERESVVGAMVGEKDPRPRSPGPAAPVACSRGGEEGRDRLPADIPRGAEGQVVDADRGRLVRCARPGGLRLGVAGRGMFRDLDGVEGAAELLDGQAFARGGHAEQAEHFIAEEEALHVAADPVGHGLGGFPSQFR